MVRNKPVEEKEGVVPERGGLDGAQEEAERDGVRTGDGAERVAEGGEGK